MSVSYVFLRFRQFMISRIRNSALTFFFVAVRCALFYAIFYAVFVKLDLPDHLTFRSQKRDKKVKRGSH